MKHAAFSEIFKHVCVCMYKCNVWVHVCVHVYVYMCTQRSEVNIRVLLNCSPPYLSFETGSLMG